MVIKNKMGIKIYMVVIKEVDKQQCIKGLEVINLHNLEIQNI